MTVIAVTTPPPIVCPSWCAVSRHEHIEGAYGESVWWEQLIVLVVLAAGGFAFWTWAKGETSLLSRRSARRAEDLYRDHAADKPTKRHNDQP